MALFINISKSKAQGHILLEISDYLLQEDGFRLQLENTDINAFTDRIQRNTATPTNISRNTTIFTNISRN